MQKKDKNKEHHHSHNLSGRKLLWVTILNLSITIVQIAGGLISNSLSLLSDALHNLGDSSAIFIAFLAGKISQKTPDKHKTFGYKRAEILAALFNATVLITICLFLLYHAYQRFLHPEPVKGQMMFSVAIFGLLANFISVIILNKNKAENLNVKAAYMHLLGDTLSSVAVIAGGIAIWHFGIFWLDPLITLIVGAYIIWHTWGILKKTVEILMQAVPRHIHLSEIKTQIEQINEIADIHHLHVWQLNDIQTHLEAHINLKEDVSMSKMMIVRNKAECLLKEKFGIRHITIQTGYNCCKENQDLIFNSKN